MLSSYNIFQSESSFLLFAVVEGKLAKNEGELGKKLIN